VFLVNKRECHGECCVRTRGNVDSVHGFLTDSLGADAHAGKAHSLANMKHKRLEKFGSEEMHRERSSLLPAGTNAAARAHPIGQKIPTYRISGHDHRFTTLFVIAAGMADEPVAIRVCPARMPDPSL
jgi:hypothetical protein